MRFWVLVVTLLVLNYLSVAIFAPGREQSVKLPYQPDFVDQVEADNVTKISTTGTAVSGELKKEVRPSTDKKAEPAKNFETEIPTFADNDQLSALLRGPQRHDRGRAGQPGPRVPAQPDPRLRPGDPARRPLRLDQQASRRRADERARLVRAVAGPPHRGRADERHVQGRRRHRRVQAGAHRGRRLPQEPRPLPQARRPHPARRAPGRPPRHRQDAARPRRGRRGGGAVLLRLRLRVRGGDRRHRGQPRPRPLQAGQGSPARDHLHRRARRHRPLAHLRPGRLRRQRRARADAQPDPHGDGRLRVRAPP